jgi:hypothetical protein
MVGDREFIDAITELTLNDRLYWKVIPRGIGSESV